MTYTGTFERLFDDPVDPHSFFEKEASISRVPDDEKKWPAHLLSELHKQLPFLSSYDVDLSIDRQDPESGYALGYAMIRNKSVKNQAPEDVGSAKNRLRIPLIVEDRQLQPFHTFELGGNVYPLTPERVESAMVNPAIFDGSVSKIPRAPSMVDNLYPPYQQRQGFGRVAEPNSAGIAGIGKSASAPISEDDFLDGLSKAGKWRTFREGTILKEAEAADAPNYRPAGDTACGSCKFFNPSESKGQGQCSKFDFTAMADHTCDAWVTRDATKEASMDKEARSLAVSAPGYYGEFDEKWLKRFEGTPLVDEAYSLKEAEAIGEADRARRRATRAQQRAEEAQFDIKIAELEGDFARWRLKQLGQPMSETLGKLASCRHDDDRTWSDEFAGTPFHKTAMQLAVGDAKRAIGRIRREAEDDADYAMRAETREKAAALELKLAEWKLNSAYGETSKEASAVKEAVAALRFQKGVGVPGSMVFANLKDKPRFRTAVMPNDFWFFPLAGTSFLMGVHKSDQDALAKENDQQKLKAMLAGPMRQEMMAARANQPSPGRFLLVVKHGNSFQYVKPQFTAALAGATGPGGGSSVAGVDQALKKKAGYLDDSSFRNDKKYRDAYNQSMKEQGEGGAGLKGFGRRLGKSLKRSGTGALIGGAAGAGLGALSASKKHQGDAALLAGLMGSQVGAGTGGIYDLHRLGKAHGKAQKAGQKTEKKAGMSFLKQDRPEKVKDIYAALKRDHPEYSAEKKARIASSKGATKTASISGILGGAAPGYIAGSRAAGGSARAAAPKGKKDKAEAIARKLAVVGVSIATVLAVIAGRKKLTPLVERALKTLSDEDLKWLAKGLAGAGAGIAGGVAAGGTIGTGVGLRERLKQMKGKK